jgi:hypothetical protein
MPRPREVKDPPNDRWGRLERNVRRLHEEGYAVGRTVIYEYLRERRRQRAEVYVPLIHRAGDEAQVDFFEVTVEIAGA